MVSLPRHAVLHVLNTHILLCKITDGAVVILTSELQQKLTQPFQTPPVTNTQLVWVEDGQTQSTPIDCTLLSLPIAWRLLMVNALMKCATFGLILVDVKMTQNTWTNNVSSHVMSLRAILETAKHLLTMKNAVTKIAIIGPTLANATQMTKNVVST
jgi:hypothetical protein